MSSSRNLQNFSFQASQAHPHPIPISRTAKPLNLQPIRTYTSQLLNPYTRQKWVDLAIQLSTTQLTAEHLAKLDQDTYRRMFQLMKDYMTVTQQDTAEVEEMVAEEARVEQKVREGEEKMAEMEAEENAKEREFRDEINKLQEKRKKLKTKYQEE